MDVTPGFTLRTAVLVGGGAIDKLGESLAYLRVDRPGLLIDPALADGPVGAVVRAAAPTCDTIRPEPGEPTYASVRLAADRVRAAGVDGLVAVGGGSTIDTGKLLRGLLATGQDDLGGVSEAEPLDALPLIAVPTTAGTGAEMGSGAIVTEPESNQKIMIMVPGLEPDIAIADGHLTAGLPASLTAYTGCDALAQALMTYSAAGYQAVSGQLSLRAIELILKWLPRAVANGQDLRAREGMMLASSLSGVAMFNAPLTWDLEHAIAEPLGSMLHVHHGLLVSAFLPGMAQFNLPALGPRYAEVARHLALVADDVADVDAARTFVEHVRTFVKQVGIPPLSEVIGERPLGPLVDHVVRGPRLQFNPVPIDAPAVEAIIAGGWDGTFTCGDLAFPDA